MQSIQTGGIQAPAPVGVLFPLPLVSAKSKKKCCKKYKKGKRCKKCPNR
jgi:hypothetical protein